MEVKLTDFAKRHFDPKFGGTKIKDFTPEKFENKLMDLNGDVKLLDGYAPFCKLLAIQNFTTARTGTMEITMENAQYLQTDYSARTEDELPVLSRFLQLPPMFKPDVAKYLMLVLYDKEQIDKETISTAEKNGSGGWIEPEMFESNWGIVAILGQMHDTEEPMNPITMMRNALGKEEGGSGVEIDRDAYQKSVKFWSQHALVN